jgi:hypothetical protein
MPYRRLPNTDLARLRALRIAFEKGKELPPFKLAFSQATLQKIQSTLHLFEAAVQESRQAYNIQVNKSQEYAKLLKKVRLYISHFIQVANMAVLRGDLNQADCDMLGFRFGQKVPALNSENEIASWGQKLIDGETLRIKNRQTPIANPSIAVVKVWYEKYLDARIFQKNLQKNVQRSQNHLVELRKTVDQIIIHIWNEVEAHYQDLPDEAKRNSCKIYGMVFFFRKNEVSELEEAKKSVN